MINIGYVPEHFSTPLVQLCAGNDEYRLIACPCGTGELIGKLESNEIDIAIALTEGLVRKIAAENTTDIRLIGTYVTSPLNWAIITAKNGGLKKTEDVENKTFGISRVGSGSQVMASVLALREGWTEPLKFKVLNDFKNLRESVNTGKADVFLWEIFTTKPFESEVDIIGSVETPWSSWMISSRTSVIDSKAEEVKRFLSLLEKSVNAFNSKESRESTAAKTVSELFNLKVEDAKCWLETVDYPKKLTNISSTQLRLVLKVLQDAGVLKTYDSDLNSYIDSRIVGLEEN